MTEDLINRFYGALADRDGEAMAACYADDIVFSDPAFGELRGQDAGDMWRMLCSSDTDLSVEHTIVEASADRASTNWVARYTFTSTGRPVRNDVTARMTLRDGSIVEHHDSFSFWKWSSQALGLPGQLLGWSPFLRSKVRRTTQASLRAFQKKRGLQ